MRSGEQERDVCGTDQTPRSILVKPSVNFHKLPQVNFWQTAFIIIMGKTKKGESAQDSEDLDAILAELDAAQTVVCAEEVVAPYLAGIVRRCTWLQTSTTARACTESEEIAAASPRQHRLH